MSHYRIPSYRKHKQSGQAVVTLTDGLGGRRDVLLGKFGTAASRVVYTRVVAEWEANGRRLVFARDAPGTLSINELLLAFVQHANLHYRREDGTTTNELNEYKRSIKVLKELYGTLAIADFGPLRLRAVRERMVAADLSRGVINQRIRRIVRLFKWGVAEEIVPESVWRSLTTMRGLERGRPPARETDPIRPVAEEVVNATLPYLLPPVRAMAQLQLLTGMRPGEACSMRGCDLDMGGPVWLYRPVDHKMLHRGTDRVIAIGPRGQEIIRPFLKLDTEAYLFSPKDAVAALHARLREQRKTKYHPCETRRKRNPKRRPGDYYQTYSYGIAIARAIRRANTAQACAGCKHLKPEERCEQCKDSAIPHWHPHQLRHTHATEVRRRFGLEAAQVALGHSQASVT